MVAIDYVIAQKKIQPRDVQNVTENYRIQGKGGVNARVAPIEYQKRGLERFESERISLN